MSNKIFSSAIDLIGETPLVALDRLTQNLKGRILAKVEFFNPGFSKKDRIAKHIIAEAENAGTLKPGQAVVELTSGNTGTGLSIVCAIKGYPFVAVMSKGNSIERARMMTALGAEVVLVDQAKDSIPGQVSGEDLALVEKVTARIVNERKAFRADQFFHDGNFNSHYKGTGQEIIRQTNGEFDVFVDFVGSGGTFGGCAKAFKEMPTNKRCYLVEPKGAAVISGKDITNPEHKIQGGGYSMPDLKFIDKNLIDGYVEISNEEAIKTARDLAKKEGIFGGFSSGANVAAALKLLGDQEKGKTIVCLICDSGLKYLSTDLYP